MKLYHCKRCGAFIGGFGYCDELCPTCRRKETYLTKEEVVVMLKELEKELTVDAIPKSVLEDIKGEIEAKIKKINNEDTVNGLLGAWTIVDNYLREGDHEDT